MKRAICWIVLTFLSGVACVADDSTLGFKLKQGHLIVVKCSVGNLKGLTGIIDTGVSESVLDVRIVKRLGLPARADRASFLSRELDVLAVAIPALQLGSMTTSPLAGIAADLHSLTAQFGIRPDVLIGMDLLRHWNLLIDYKNEELSFTSLPVSIMKNQAPIRVDAHVPMIEARFQGKTLNLQIDTGAEGVLLYDCQLPAPSGQIHLASLSGDLPASPQLGQLQVGERYFARSEVLAIKACGQIEFDGILGPRALHANRVAFDFAHGIMTWE